MDEVTYKYPIDFCKEKCPCLKKRKTGRCPALDSPKKFIALLPPELQEAAYQALLVQEGLEELEEE